MLSAIDKTTQKLLTKSTNPNEEKAGKGEVTMIHNNSLFLTNFNLLSITCNGSNSVLKIGRRKSNGKLHKRSEQREKSKIMERYEHKMLQRKIPRKTTPV